VDDIDLDNIEDLTCEKVGEAINRTIDRLERLQALYTAVAESDRRKIERLIQEWRRGQRRSTAQPGSDEL
jgi:DNA-binding transcriptional regulator YbjK